MATHDYVIDNQTSANARADINNVLQAILTNNSSSTAPTVTNANMFWYDTANNVLKMRNEADTGWIIVGYLNQTNNQMEVRTDVIQAASGSGISVKNSSGTTIIDLSVASQATAEAGTEDTQVMTPLKVKQSIAANVTPSGWEYVGGATGTGTTTQTVSGLNIYRTVKVLVDTQTSGNATNTVSAATTSTYRTITTELCERFDGSITIHNWNNADAPSGIKFVDNSLSTPQDYPDREDGPTDEDERLAVRVDTSGQELNYNEAWNVVRYQTTGYASQFGTYKFRVFGMR